MNEGFHLEARAIHKSFGGVEVLHGVDLEARGGSVLALLGENGAGKSTLVKIIAGDYKPDSGEVAVGGAVKSALDPVQARDLGIRMIFQEIMDAPPLTVAENIALGQLPLRRGIVDWRGVRRQAARLLSELDVDIDPNRTVGELRIGQRQVVEIARELNGNARCLIMDEPTAALSNEEVQRLFELVRDLRNRGVAIIYITHRLDEIPLIADRVHVLRDGDVVLSGPVADFTRNELVQAMIGRAVTDVQRPPRASREPGDTPAVRLRNADSSGSFADVNLDVYPGEVVALYGKLGSGAAEIADCIFGLRRLTSGAFELFGQPVVLKGPHEAIRAGIGFLPADRQGEGAFLVRSVAENLAAPSWGRLAKLGLFISSRIETAAARRWTEALRIRSRNDPGQLLGTLSGGNQQKVLLGRWLEHGSRILVLVEPTRGVDVGARQDVYRLVRSLATQGIAVLVSTSDYEEVVQLADRAVVMARGRLVTELGYADVRTDTLLAEGGR